MPNKFPVEASSDQTIKVFYAEETSMIPMTRADVWDAIGGITNGMDNSDVFLPESTGYRVFLIRICNNDGKNKPILQPNLHGVVKSCDTLAGPPSSLSFTSMKNVILKSLKCPVPLVVLCRGHPNCSYSWRCVDNPKIEYPSTPVIHVRDPFIFICSVSVLGQVFCSVNFDVTFQPVTELNSSDDEHDSPISSYNLEDSCHIDEYYRRPSIVEGPSNVIELSIPPPSCMSKFITAKITKCQGCRKNFRFVQGCVLYPPLDLIVSRLERRPFISSGTNLPQ